MKYEERHWFEIFPVLIETGHFTRTVKALGMTQQGVLRSRR